MLAKKIGRTKMPRGAQFMDKNDKWLKALYVTALVALILSGVLIGWIIHSVKAVGEMLYAL